MQNNIEITYEHVARFAPGDAAAQAYLDEHG